MTQFKMTRRAAALGLAASLAFGAAAETYPSRPIKIIVAFGAGGTGDLIARLYGQKMSEILKTPVIIENKPGAQQLLAIRSLMSSPPDGYTLYLATGSSLVQNPALRTDLPYDPRKDFTMIGLVDTVTGVIFTNPDLPIHSLKDFVAYAKANPDKVNYGSAGIGTAGHLAAEALIAATGIKMTHIAYKSDSDVIREVMAGTVQLGIMTTLNTVEAVKAGKIRALAVTTRNRLPYLPEVQSLSETGIKSMSNLDPHTFHALVGPAKLPTAIAARLNDVINKVSTDPEVVNRMRTGFYAEPAISSPTSVRTFLDKELAKWMALGKTIKLTE